MGGAQNERRAFLGVHATADGAKLAAGANADVVRAAAQAREAADTLEAIRLARASDAPKPAPGAAAAPRDAVKPRAFNPAPASAELDPPDKVRKRHDEAMQVLQKH